MRPEDFREFCKDYDVAVVVMSRDRGNVLTRFTDRLASEYILFWTGTGYDQPYNCVDRIEVPSAIGGRAAVGNHILRTLDQKVVIILEDDIHAVYWAGATKAYRLDPPGFRVMLTNLVVNALDAKVGLFGVSEGDIRHASPLMPFHPRSPCTGAIVGIVGRKVWYDERSRLRCDLDFALQHLRDGRLTWKDQRYLLVQDRRTLPGGHSVFRSSQRELEEGKALQRWWGADVISVNEQNRRASIHVPS